MGERREKIKEAIQRDIDFIAQEIDDCEAYQREPVSDYNKEAQLRLSMEQIIKWVMTYAGEGEEE